MNENQDKFLIPASIVVAGVIVALAIIYARVPAQTGTLSDSGNKNKGATSDTVGELTFRAVDSSDHILGNPNASVKIVEYSDLECPFCKTFHVTLHKIMDEYGKDGQVAWVYRHFPLESLHPKAPKEAEATECAFELGGNNAFWAYVDKLFSITPSNNGLDPAKLPQIATGIGLNRAQFEACLSSGKFAEKVRENYQDALTAGGNGTPYSIVISKNGEKFPISGAAAYKEVKKIIEQALSAR